MFLSFLSAGDGQRALQAFENLARHDISRWALTGGFATEIHHLRRGRRPLMRSLNDIDFIVDSFDCIPRSLAGDFMFRHIHPLDPPGKTLMQFVDADRSLRMDVFRAFGATMRRTELVDLPYGRVHLISLEDLLARAARLALDLSQGVPVPSKYARDYLRLADLANPDEVETAWQDQRKPFHPATFREADRLLRELIPARSGLLFEPNYSKDTAALCPRCAPAGAFQLADANQVLAALGYC